MSKVISPYYSRNNYVLPISLLPHQINSNYKEQLLSNLRQSYEGKCSRDAFIIKIYEITEYGVASIPTKNVTSSVEFAQLLVKAYICIPHKHDIILMKIDSNDENTLKLSNGTIKGHCRKTKISDKFTINKKSNQIFYKEKEIQINDIVIVEVNDVGCINKNTQIDIICSIIDIASKKQIEQFNKENSMDLDTNNNDDKFI